VHETLTSVKVVLCWVVSLLVVIGAGVGAEGASGSRSAAPQAVSVPPLLLRELWNLSQAVATGQGDAMAAPREAVGPVGRQLAEQVTSGAGVDGNVPVYVIEMEGHFVCDECSGPRGAQAPTGDVVTETLSASTLFDTDFGIGGRWTSLARLGKPFDLPRPPDGALFWTLATGPGVTSFTGQWSGPDGEMTLADLGGRSSIVWSNGHHFIDFTLNESRTGTAAHLPSEAAGGISSDNVGLPPDSRIVLLAGEAGIAVMTTPTSRVALPGPFKLDSQ
jgi:hypothetical protein